MFNFTNIKRRNYNLTLKIDKSKVTKILCIKPRGIGDIILSTIILENLKSFFPKAEIHYLTEKFAKPAVEHNPLVEKVHTMEKGESPFSVALRLRKEKFNLILDLWSNPRTALITFLIHSKYRVGFSYKGRKYAYNIPATSSRGEVHSAEHNLELLKILEIPVISKNIFYSTSSDDKLFADKFFIHNKLENKFVIGIVPAGGWASKRCDPKKWIEICKSINEKFNITFLILWGPEDHADAIAIHNGLNGKSVIPLQTWFNQMSALIEKCNLIIANDSGPMHVAAALKIPTIGIFGPTDPQKHGPYSKNSTFVIKEDLDCIICNHLECPIQHQCMRELPVNKVLESLINISPEINSYKK